jgi:hypothetical protein
MRTLEDRYHRLLAWYPRDHRATHEDEMVGVLLASAEPGQTSPTAGDRADLYWGGLKLHTRRAFGQASARSWRDALGVAGVVGTLIFLVQAVTSMALASVAGYWVPARFVDLLLVVIAALAVVADQRWVAALATWTLWLNQLPWIAWDTHGSAGPFAIDGWMPLLAGTAVALSLGSAPQRGLRLAGPRRLLPWAVVLAAVMLWEDRMFWFGRAPDLLLFALPMIVLCAIACGYALTSGLGRRSLAILAVPIAYGLADNGMQLFRTPGWLLAFVVGLAIALFVQVGRTTSRSRNPDGARVGVVAGGRA